MASLASNNPIPRSYDSNPANSDGANTIPKRGLSHLVSKFETLDKGPGVNRTPVRKQSGFLRQPPGLPTSQTMSSLGSFQDNRRNFGNANRYNLDNVVSPIASSPMNAGPAALAPAKLSTPKLDTPQPKNANDKSRIAATVAEKRKLFETGTAQVKRTSDAAITSASSSKPCSRLNVTPSAQIEKSNPKLSMSQSCSFSYSTPKTVPDSPTKAALSAYSLQQHARQNPLKKLQHSSIHTVPASSVVLRLHHDSDSSRSATGNVEKPRSQNLATPKLSTAQSTQVSSTGSPIKKVAKFDIKAADKIPLPASPISTAKPAREPLAATIPNANPPLSKLDTPCLAKSQGDVFKRTNSTVTTAKGQPIPLRAKGWSPQRIVTPQKPTMSKDISPMGQSQGEGKFIKAKNPGNFKDAVGFFEAMSHKASLTPNATPAHEAAKPSVAEIHASTRPAGKRERFKGSLRKLSSSWRLKRGTSLETAKLLSDYPAMWKVGSIDSTPRKRLHAEWCEVSADDRRPLKASNADEISLFDPYMSTSHAKSYRSGGNSEPTHVSVLLQQSSLHGIAPGGKEFELGTYSSTTDRSCSPPFDCPEVLEPPRRPNRRWFSRSSATLISQAHCQLEQPRPVHGVELKRLISLCKMQGSIKRRGHSE